LVVREKLPKALWTLQCVQSKLSNCNLSCPADIKIMFTNEKSLSREDSLKFMMSKLLVGVNCLLRIINLHFLIAAEILLFDK
jgi:hypothetical protein